MAVPKPTKAEANAKPVVLQMGTDLLRDTEEQRAANIVTLKEIAVGSTIYSQYGWEGSKISGGGARSKWYIEGLPVHRSLREMADRVNGTDSDTDDDEEYNGV